MPFDAMRARTERRPFVRYEIPTGHPPPLEQIADQVRCATGYTLGRASVDGPRLVLLAPRAAPELDIVWTREKVLLALGRTSRAAQVFEFLADVALSGARLPAMAEMVRQFGFKHQVQLDEVLEALCVRGFIRMWNGAGKGYRGQRAIRLVFSGAVISTPRAPAGIAP